MSNARRTRDERLKAHIYSDILQQIVSRQLAPGDRLVEKDLAQTYHVSRTPIREVLFRLHSDGLVERVQNKGARVVSFTADDLENLWEIRQALECLCVRKACRTIELHALMDLERRLETMRGKSGRQWCSDHAAIDVALHRLIIAQARNPRLQDYLENLSLLIHSLRMLGYRNEEFVRQTGEEHLEIIHALLRRDAEQAEAALAKHIESGKQHILELVFQGQVRDIGVELVQNPRPPSPWVRPPSVFHPGLASA